MLNLKNMRLLKAVKPIETDKEKQATISPSLEAYETRRKEIADSTEPIEGIFYIIDGKLVPDYYSECLFSEVATNPLSEINIQNPRKCAMYSWIFFDHYVKHVYDGVACRFDMLPHGRVRKMTSEMAAISIDFCYFNNEDILQQIKELYRLPKTIRVISYHDYCCPNCAGSTFGLSSKTLSA